MPNDARNPRTRFMELYADHLDRWVAAELRDGGCSTQEELAQVRFGRTRQWLANPRTKRGSISWADLGRVIQTFRLNDEQARELQSEWLADRLTLGRYEPELDLVFGALRDALSKRAYADLLERCRDSWERRHRR